MPLLQNGQNHKGDDIHWRWTSLNPTMETCWRAVFGVIDRYTQIYKYLHLWQHSGKESACQCRRHKRCRFYPWVGKIPWKRKWQSALVFLPGKIRGQRSLVGYSPWGSQWVRHGWAHTHLTLRHFASQSFFLFFLLFLLSLLTLLQYCFCFMFWFFGQEACGILVLLQPWIQPAASAFKGEVLTTGPPGKSHHSFFFSNPNLLGPGF